MAILKHYSQLPGSSQHEDCPKGATSWCKYQADLARNDGKVTYVAVKNPLSTALYDVLLPTFNALSDVRLLSACTKCKDQNANESLHHVIWSKLPKDQNHSPAEVSFGINLAVMLFNDGHVSTMSALHHAGSLHVPQQSIRAWSSMDTSRVNQSIRYSNKDYKEKRKHKRKSKLKQLDAFQHSEGTMYKSGAFHCNKQKSPSCKQGGQRKAPVCKTCKKPRKGHRKGSCVSTTQQQNITSI